MRTDTIKLHIIQPVLSMSFVQKFSHFLALLSLAWVSGGGGDMVSKSPRNWIICLVLERGKLNKYWKIQGYVNLYKCIITKEKYIL